MGKKHKKKSKSGNASNGNEEKDSNGSIFLSPIIDPDRLRSFLKRMRALEYHERKGAAQLELNELKEERAAQNRQANELSTQADKALKAIKQSTFQMAARADRITDYLFIAGVGNELLEHSERESVQINELVSVRSAIADGDPNGDMVSSLEEIYSERDFASVLQVIEAARVIAAENESEVESAQFQVATGAVSIKCDTTQAVLSRVITQKLDEQIKFMNSYLKLCSDYNVAYKKVSPLQERLEGATREGLLADVMKASSASNALSAELEEVEEEVSKISKRLKRERVELDKLNRPLSEEEADSSPDVIFSKRKISELEKELEEAEAKIPVIRENVKGDVDSLSQGLMSEFEASHFAGSKYVLFAVSRMFEIATERLSAYDSLEPLLVELEKEAAKIRAAEEQIEAHLAEYE